MVYIITRIGALCQQGLWVIAMRGLAWLLWIAAGALAGEGAGVSVKVQPAFEGHFRVGAPLWLRVSVVNGGPGFEGTLELRVGGLAFRQPLRVGGHTTALAEALVVARAEGAQVRAVVRTRRGEVLHDAGLALGLRRSEGRPLVVGVGASKVATEDLFGHCQVAVAAEELPALAAGYATVDGLGISGDGGDVGPSARAAIAAWVRGGGVVGFVLEDAAPVRTDSLLAELGGCAGRATSVEWLAAVAARRPTQGVDGGQVWRLGLGRVAAGTQKTLVNGWLGRFLRAEPARDEWVDKGLYTAFRRARWDAGVRWRLAGGAAALLAAGALVAQLGLRGRRRVVRAGLAVGVAALLAAVAWGVMLPSGRGTRETVCVLERVEGQAGERRTEVVCLEAMGSSRVRLAFGAAEAVVPFYYSAEDAGGGDAVIERDEAGRWTVECALTRHTRRCFAAWWPWREASQAEHGIERGDVVVRGGRFAVAGDGGKVPDETSWRALGQLPGWGDAHGALCAWQARRAGPPGPFRVRPDFAWGSLAVGSGFVDERVLAAQVWVDAAH